MVPQLQAVRRPWPGPRPYTESDRQLFFGRKREQYEVLERLDAERFVLLTAPSAVGKTSFLRAAVVPELRLRRLQALRHAQPTVYSAIVVVRDWSTPDVVDVDRFFIRAVKAGIDNIQEDVASYGPDDAPLLLEEQARLAATDQDDGDAFQYIQRLASMTGGLILILDQFEEALQGSMQHVNDLSLLLVRLFNAASNVRILLSFREEFLSRIVSTPLGEEIRDLPGRTVYLSQLRAFALREAVLSSAKTSRVEFAEDALDELLSWMVDAQSTPRSSVNTNRAARVALQSPAAESDAAVDLLKLQALLLQLWAVAQQDSQEPDVISESDLQRLRRVFGLEAGREVSGPEVVERALQRFIDGLLPLPASVATATGVPSSQSLSGEGERLLRQRRAAARMGPSFSSGGFKVQQELASLLARAWREEWEVIGVEVDEVEDRLRAAGDLLDDINTKLHGWLTSWAPDKEGQDEDSLPLSGLANRERWSVRAAALDLIETSVQTLEILRLGNVLRRKSGQEFITYELSHDGFGDALFDWAEDVRAQPLDAVSAIIAERGTAFRWTRLAGAVRNVSWRGCWIGPDVDRTKRLVIDNVRFDHCDLRGTVFNRCDFTGGGFHHCDLEGAVFWDCTFEGTETHPFVFDAVEGSSLSFDDGSKLTHVHFSGESTFYNMSWHRLIADDVALDRCVLNKMTVGEVTLAGPLTIRRSWILLSDLNDLRVTEGGPVSLLTISDCDLFYCRLRGLSELAAENGSGNRRYPDPHDMPGEPPLRDTPASKDPWREPS